MKARDKIRRRKVQQLEQEDDVNVSEGKSTVGDGRVHATNAKLSAGIQRLQKRAATFQKRASSQAAVRRQQASRSGVLGTRALQMAREAVVPKSYVPIHTDGLDDDDNNDDDVRATLIDTTHEAADNVTRLIQSQMDTVNAQTTRLAKTGGIAAPEPLSILPLPTPTTTATTATTTIDAAPVPPAKVALPPPLPPILGYSDAVEGPSKSKRRAKVATQTAQNLTSAATQQQAAATLLSIQKMATQAVPVNALMAGVTTMSNQLASLQTDARLPVGVQPPQSLPWRLFLGEDSYRWKKQAEIKQAWSKAQASLVWTSGSSSSSSSSSSSATSHVPTEVTSLAYDGKSSRVVVAGAQLLSADSKSQRTWQPFLTAFSASSPYAVDATWAGASSVATVVTALGPDHSVRADHILVDPNTGASYVLLNVAENDKVQLPIVATTVVLKLTPTGQLDASFDYSQLANNPLIATGIVGLNLRPLNSSLVLLGRTPSLATVVCLIDRAAGTVLDTTTLKFVGMDVNVIGSSMWVVGSTNNNMTAAACIQRVDVLSDDADTLSLSASSTSIVLPVHLPDNEDDKEDDNDVWTWMANDVQVSADGQTLWILGHRIHKPQDGDTVDDAGQTEPVLWIVPVAATQANGPAAIIPAPLVLQLPHPCVCLYRSTLGPDDSESWYAVGQTRPLADSLAGAQTIVVCRDGTTGHVSRHVLPSTAAVDQMSGAHDLFVSPDGGSLWIGGFMQTRPLSWFREGFVASLKL